MVKNRKKGYCRFCKNKLRHSFVDLGVSPLANSYLTPEHLHQAEPFYPLHAYVCDVCYLVQLNTYKSPEDIFNNYAYFSSYSDTWLKHCQDYTNQMVERFSLNVSSHVVEVGSNDGYLLRYFKKKGIPVLGIEPAKNIAREAESVGIPSVTEFFGTELAMQLAAEGKQADLLLGNNVLAHVPDINDFVKGMKILLKPGGIITMEFPHLLHLIEEKQFDTIYHEHLSYLSLSTTEEIFAKNGLILFDVDELPTHGGSLRIYARHLEDNSRGIGKSIGRIKHLEFETGLRNMAVYSAFEEGVKGIKRELLDFLITVKRRGKSVVGYGAPAKATTLLTYCGIRTDFIDYTVDRSSYKQGRFLPGIHIPIYHPDKIKETKPDYILILPWNLKKEIISQMAFIKSWGGKFVIPIPRLEVLS